MYRVQILRGTLLCHTCHKIQLKIRFTDLSLEIPRLDYHISFDKNWFSRFISETTSFWIWTQMQCNPPLSNTPNSVTPNTPPPPPSPMSVSWLRRVPFWLFWLCLEMPSILGIMRLAMKLKLIEYIPPSPTSSFYIKKSYLSRWPRDWGKNCFLVEGVWYCSFVFLVDEECTL